MFREGANLPGRLLGIIIALLFAAVVLTPVAHPIRSIEKTMAIIDELGYRWPSQDVPVLVFVSPHCPASNALEAELNAHGIHYLRVDVDTNEVGRAIHGRLGRNYLGTVATRATPTTVVGTAVIRGNNIDRILRELSAQGQK